jgi:hypothetical protein
MGAPRARPLVLPSDPAEIGYLAGLIDGEGYIGITKAFDPKKSKNYSHSIRVVITNSDPRLISWLMSIGGRQSAKGRKDNWKQAWNWQITSKNAYAFLKLIRPYVKLKGQQADICIALQDLKRIEGHPKFSLSSVQVARREAMMAEILVLNRRGEKVG